MNSQVSTVRYFGSKAKMAKDIISLMPEHTCYVEPFGGSAAVLLQKSKVGNEIYNDINDEVVNFFKVLREQDEALIKAIELTPYARSEHVGSFEVMDHDSDLERARKFAIKSFFSYSAAAAQVKDCKTIGFRTTRKGGLSVANDWRNYPKRLQWVIERLKHVIFEHQNYAQIISKYDSKDTLFFIDPPYVQSTRADKRYGHDFSDKDHEQLLKMLNSVKAKVVLSGYPSELYKDLLSAWHQKEFNIKLTNSSHGDVKHMNRTEVVWCNFEIEDQQLNLFNKTQ